MATIALFPFPAYGHLNPTLKLARALKQAGHRVCYLGLADFEDYIRSQGLEFIPILENSHTTDASGSTKARSQVNPLEVIGIGANGQAGKINHTQLNEIARQVKPIIQDMNPDLLIVDFLIGGFAYMVAQEFGIAGALIDTTLVEGIMLGGPAPESMRCELPVLVLCPEAFELPGTARNPNRYYIEPSVDLQRQELHAFPWEALDQSKPLIYASLGSQAYVYEHSARVFGAIVEAMSEKPEWQLVMAIGPHLKTTDFEPLPANVLMVNWAPQLKMLERAAMMITHGGLGAVKECIMLSVPMIVFPCRWDQPFNAARVVAHGLGMRGNINQVTAQQVANLIDSVATNPTLKRRMAAMSQTFRQIEDSRIGVKVVESILSQAHDQPARSTDYRSSAIL